MRLSAPARQRYLGRQRLRGFCSGQKRYSGSSVKFGPTRGQTHEEFYETSQGRLCGSLLELGFRQAGHLQVARGSVNREEGYCIQESVDV